MKYLFYFLLLFISASVSAQVGIRNALSAGFGLSRHFQEKVNAPTLLLSFRKDFHPRTMIEMNAAWTTPVDVSTETETRDLESLRFGMNLLFKILEERKQAFHAGLGFSAGFYATEWLILATEETGSTSEFNPGFTALVEYDYILPSGWFLGGRASISSFDGGRSIGLVSGVLGYTF